MTREKAIELAASWWYSMIRNGKWDNGDAKTEFTHEVFKSFAYQPTEADYETVKHGLVEMVIIEMDRQQETNDEITKKYGGTPSELKRFNIYADYGCGPLEDLYKRLGLKMSSRFHGPQKAGTTIVREGSEYKVMAKEGYGGEWKELKSAE